MSTKRVRILEQVIKFLHIFGWLSPKGYTNNVFQKIILMTISLISPFGAIGHLIHCTKNECSFRELVEDITNLLNMFIAYTFFVFLLTNQNKVFRLLKDIGDFTVYPKPHTFESLDRKLNFVAKVVTYGDVIIGLVLWGTFTVNEVWLHKCPEDAEIKCNMVSYMVYPIDVHYYPMRIVINFFFIASSVLIVTNILLFCFLCTFSIDLVVNRIIHLRMYIREIKFLVGHIRDAHLNECIEIQNVLISLTQRINVLFTSLSFVLVPIITATITLLIAQILWMRQVAQVFILSGSVSCVLLISLSGEHLANETNKLTEDIFYSVAWDGDVKFERKLVIVMRRCNTPTLLKNRFINIDVGLFMSIMRSAITFATAMMQFY